MTNRTRELFFATHPERDPRHRGARSRRRLLSSIGASMTLGALVAVALAVPAAQAVTVAPPQSCDQSSDQSILIVDDCTLPLPLPPVTPAPAPVPAPVPAPEPAPAPTTQSLTSVPADVVSLIPGVPTRLTGLAVTGDPTDTLSVTVGTSSGTLSMTPASSPLLSYGSWSGTSYMTLQGMQADINTTLATTTITGGRDASASVSISAQVQDAVNPIYLSSTDHYYAYVRAPGETWLQADKAAKALSYKGQPGYLATIADPWVNDSISYITHGEHDVLFGARAYESMATDGSQVYATVGGVTYPRVWRWTVGADESPIQGTVMTICTNYTWWSNPGSTNGSAGDCVHPPSDTAFSSWNTGEPNNDGTNGTSAYQGEWTAVTNFASIPGKWNDAPNSVYANSSGYVVEFGGKTNKDSSFGMGYSLPSNAYTALPINVGPLVTLVATTPASTALAGVPVEFSLTGADAYGNPVDVTKGVTMTVDAVPSASRTITFKTGGLHTVVFTDLTTGLSAKTSVSVVAMTKDLPAITWATPGVATTLTVAASDKLNTAVIWWKSAKPGGPWTMLGGPGDASYTFIPTASYVYYHATITTMAGPIVSTVTSIRVATLPVVVTQPNVSTTVTLGNKLILTSTGKGVPYPTMKWQISTNSGLSWADVAGATTTTFAFTPLVTGTRYRAQYTNLAGSTNSAASVAVVVPIKKK